MTDSWLSIEAYWDGMTAGFYGLDGEVYYFDIDDDLYPEDGGARTYFVWKVDHAIIRDDFTFSPRWDHDFTISEDELLELPNVVAPPASALSPDSVICHSGLVPG